ncbi:MAG: single-stranded-DNA-specific exonuclease RecJ [bacterium]|nr:single-stranded-DNA-specific exonuclease RecJ [bacterium]
MEKRWVLCHLDADRSNSLSGQLGISSLTAQVLVNRGVCEPESARAFLDPSLADMHDPGQLKGIKEAVVRIEASIVKKEQITVYGDYDVDGTTSTALLVLFLRELGSECNYYIPDRMKEGYGLNSDAVKSLASAGTRLIITVDNGISSYDETALASSLGMDIIITDHHHLPDKTPPALAVINPQQDDCPYHFKALAGVGVAFNLIAALRTHLREKGYWNRKKEPNLRKYFDLAALGTIADIVPLLETNRLFAHFGLKELTASTRPGIMALKRVSGIDDGEINAGKVGFQLAPRLNAAGRLSTADMGVKLLMTVDDREARELAEKLDHENRERRAIEKEIFEDALAILEKQGTDRLSSIVLASEKWHPGVIGIVASRLVERYYLPTLLISIKDGEGKGSARSIAAFHLFEGLKECSSHLLGFGGHKYAAGFSIKEDKIKGFAEAFDSVVHKTLEPEDFTPSLKIDATLDLSDIDDKLVSDLEKMLPFGPSNPEPVFLSEDIEVKEAIILKDTHLKMKLDCAGTTFDGIAFNMKDKGIKTGDRVSIVFSPRFNLWRGRRSIQLNIKDIRNQA